MNIIHNMKTLDDIFTDFIITQTQGDIAMYCTKCGRQNNDTAKFCGYCGNPLEADGVKKITFRSAVAKAPARVRTTTPEKTSEAALQRGRWMHLAALVLIALQMLFFFLPFCTIAGSSYLDAYGSLGKSLQDATTFSLLKFTAQGSDIYFICAGMFLVAVAGIMEFSKVVEPTKRRLSLTILSVLALLINLLFVAVDGNGISFSSSMETTWVYPTWIVCAFASVALVIAAHISTPKN